jgi:hypothetical protein
LTLGKSVFVECLSVPSVQHSVKSLVAERLVLPSAALGKSFFAECPTKGTRQRFQHSAKPWIPVVNRRNLKIINFEDTLHPGLGLEIINLEFGVWNIVALAMSCSINADNFGSKLKTM